MSQPSDPIAQPAIAFLGLGRAAFGIATIVIPIASCDLFRIPISISTTMIARMFGAREAAIGLLLWSAENDRQKQTKELKRALWAGVAVDAMDVVCCTYAFATGQLDSIGFGMLSGAAVSLVAIGLLTMQKVNAERKEGINQKRI
jgi:hypothetical protein